MADPHGKREHWLLCLIGLVLTFGTLACYWPAYHFDFVSFDDPVYVSENHMVRQGLTWPGVVWAFHCVKGGNWNPLVWLSHMADCQIFGMTPGGHHLTNMILHTANALLLFLALKKMTGAIWRSGWVAAIFAWHPLHVESVAWVSERKDVLSTFFFMLTLLAYAFYVRSPKSNVQGPKAATPAPEWGFYGLTLLFFACGLMSKPMLVTLPFVLLLLDYWPLRRAEALGKLVREKLPFAALSLAACVLAVWAQKSAGALLAVPLPLRLENAAVACASYLGKFFWPVDLAVFYPYPDAIPRWRAAGAVLLLGAVSWAVIQGTKRRRYLGVGWFWFLGTLVPVIGLVQVGMQAMADRYTYIPYIGLALMASWGLADLAAAWPRGRPALASAAALALGGCLAVTSSQIQSWRDSITLFEHALKVTSDNCLAQNNLACVLQDKGKLDEAAQHFKEVIRLRPNLGQPYSDLGKVYILQDRIDDAMVLFTNALARAPQLADARWNLGNAHRLKGHVEQGLAEMQSAVRLNPDDIDAPRKFAEMLIKLGRGAEAVPYCETVVQARPDDAHAHFALGSAYLAAKRVDQAVAHFKEAGRLAPGTPECLNTLAWIYATSPQAEFRHGPEAVRLATEACTLTKRQKPGMLDTLAAAYAETGRFDEAIKTTEEFRALALASGDTAMADLARQRLALYQAGKPCRDEP